jgi:hypothetical protein
MALYLAFLGGTTFYLMLTIPVALQGASPLSGSTATCGPAPRAAGPTGSVATQVVKIRGPWAPENA